MTGVETPVAPPLVSINMCCYNAEAYLEEALAGIFAQVFQDWELVVVDDGSTDGTAAILERWRRTDRRMVVHHQENQGLGRARNAALSLSTGTHVAFVDSDDVWLPAFLSTVVPLLAENPRCAVAYSDVYRIDADGRITGRISDDVEYLRGVHLAELVHENFVSANSAIVIRQDALREVGGFNPVLRIAEEYELYLKIALTGHWEFDFTPEPLVKYRWHGGNVSRKLEALARECLAILDDLTARFPDQMQACALSARRRRIMCYFKIAVSRLREGRILSALPYIPRAMAAVRFNPVELARAVYLHGYRRRMRRVLKSGVDALRPPAGTGG